MSTKAELEALAPLGSVWDDGEGHTLTVHGWHPMRPPSGGLEVLTEGGIDRTPRYRRTDDFRPGGRFTRRQPERIGGER